MLVGTRIKRRVWNLVEMKQRLDRRNVPDEDLVESAVPAQRAQTFVKPEIGPSDRREISTAWE